MSKAKGKTLVQILAEELKEWPEGSDEAFQDGDKEVRFTDPKHDFFASQLAVEDKDISCADGIPWAGPVTRAQWEAESAKLSKPKANAQGWISHRGGKCPVADGVRVDYWLRSGSVGVNERAELLDWGRDDGSPGSDIMAYRINQPDQQPIEKASDARVDECAATEPGHAEMPAAKYFDGPLQWRDRISEIDAEEARLNAEHRNAIEVLEEERVSLVQRLADEGLQLISSNCKHAATQLEEWQRLAMINGQKVAAVKAHREKYSSGLKEAVDAVDGFRNEKGFVAV